MSPSYPGGLCLDCGAKGQGKNRREAQAALKAHREAQDFRTHGLANACHECRNAAAFDQHNVACGHACHNLEAARHD